MRKSYWSKISTQRVGRRRALALTGGTGLGAALLAACGGGEGGGVKGDKTGLVTGPVDTTKQAKRGGIRKFYLIGEPAGLDPAIANTRINPVQSLIYGELLRFKDGYLEDTVFEPEPHLAESWEWSPDKLSLILKIRQGVKLQNVPPVNGRLFDVEDVVFAWNRFASVGGDRSSIAAVANPAAPVVSVTATDTRTVVFKLQAPNVTMLALLAAAGSGQIKMMPREADSQFDPRSTIIGTGPYILTDYKPSIGFTFKANPDYWEKEHVFLDQVDMPIIPEYTTAVAQLRAGQLYDYGTDLKSEDVLTVKRETPGIALYKTNLVITGHLASFGWLPQGKSPFLDERVRQAYSLSLDRDLWIDTFYGAARLEAEGLPVERVWNSSTRYMRGWTLDPKDEKSFGPNAKYFRQDIAEAKKLLAASGYPNGLDVTSYYIAGPEYGTDYQKRAEVLDGFAREIGFRPAPHLLQYATEFIPNYRNGKGQYDGWLYKTGSPSTTDGLALAAFDHYSKGSVNFHGFVDTYVDAEIERMYGEVDTEKRRASIFELQRYLGKKQYSVRHPGGATGFTTVWPALRNWYTNQGGRRVTLMHDFWIDQTQPPFTKA